MKKIIITTAILASSATMAFDFFNHDHAHGEEKVFSPVKTFPFGADGQTLEGVSKNTIYLSFDDGPTSAATPKILDTLKEYKIKATFFVVGKMANANQSILAEIRGNGHRLANHSYNHETNMKSDIEFLNTLNGTHDVIKSYMKEGDLSLFRAPGGNWKDWQAVAGNGDEDAKKYIGPIFWNVGGGNGNAKDDADWKCWSTWYVSPKRCGKSYIEQIEKNYKNGRASIVLMHDINEKSAEMLEYILKQLSKSKIDWKYDLIENIPAVKKNK